MTRDEAEASCAELAAEHPDRKTHQWRPREEADGSWSVVKVAVPPTAGARAEELVADERPATPDDPRDAHMRNVGPWVGPGA